MKRYRNFIITGILFFIFGVILVAFSSIDAYKYKSIYFNRVKTTAKVVDVNYKTKTTIITYEVGDQLIQKELNLIDTSMEVDSTIDIYYDFHNPTSSLTVTQIKFIIIYFILGLLLVIIFIVLFVIVLIKCLKR